MERAFEKLPSNLGYLLSEVPKWFSKSTLRREAFNNLFQVMDANNDRRGTPEPFQKMSTTRWLVHGKVIYSLLVNWHELKVYFSAVLPTANASCRIRMHVQFQGKCCTDFKASERMLERFTSQNMYGNLEDRDDSEGGDPGEGVEEFDLLY
ncbi:hypothetical protein AAFF_G00148040 [Aldrovandia affinis]|uniref:Uncharacterized protein n=1 Tax=Aldrovandia affinis TaxID=143900 RepID=A0AAD7RPG8_9TELE|nr:hypothetical protein AAFF_G00148040 [Aldrovandia affinis]